MSKSLIRTGGKWVDGHGLLRPCDDNCRKVNGLCQGYYQGGKEEEGHFGVASDIYKVGGWAHVSPIYSLLETDGKAYKQFIKACAKSKHLEPVE